MRSLALELAPRGVRANSVLVGVVPTAMTTARRGAASVDEQLDALRALHPLGRLGTPEEVGRAVVSLLENPWVTGAELAVDGGLLAG
jgi:NAD(P)-dependent dehydrogenase (short-subunit alcohol dehydrogenase family)